MGTIGIDNLRRAAAGQGALLEETYLLDGASARQARLRIGGQSFVWASNGNTLYLSIPTSKVAVRLNIGRTDRPVPIDRYIGNQPLYLAEPWDDWSRQLIDATRSWLTVPAHIALLGELGLGRQEWASFEADWSLVELRSRPGDEDSRRVHVVLRIVEAATDPAAPWLRQPRLATASVPPQFRDLIPMMRVWAIDDDAIRSDKMSRARTATLLRLWDAVGHRLDAIDSYLDAHADAFSDGDSKLGRLAEATAEARIELEHRGVDVRPGRADLGIC